MKLDNAIWKALDVILVICGFVFGILEWLGIFHTISVTVGFLWFVLAFAAIERLTRSGSHS